MADIWSQEKRSEVMSKIRGKDTKPEMLVRSALHKLGFRFRLHRKDLSGRPDIVLARYKTVVFVNGCFWHHHKECKLGGIPKTRTEWWVDKFARTAERDQHNYKVLKDSGWEVLVIWECEIERGLDDVIVGVVQKLEQRI